MGGRLRGDEVHPEVENVHEADGNVSRVGVPTTPVVGRESGDGDRAAHEAAELRAGAGACGQIRHPRRSRERRGSPYARGRRRSIGRHRERCDQDGVASTTRSALARTARGRRAQRHAADHGRRRQRGRRVTRPGAQGPRRTRSRAGRERFARTGLEPDQAG